MSGFEQVLVSYVLNSLWQAPLVYAAAWIAARGLRAAGPAAEHRVWVSALLLESALPAVSLLPWEKMQLAWPLMMHGGVLPDGQVSFEMGAGAGAGFAGVRLPSGVMGALATMYAVLTGYFIARFVWRCVRLSWLSRGAEPMRLSGDDFAISLPKLRSVSAIIFDSNGPGAIALTVMCLRPSCRARCRVSWCTAALLDEYE